MTHYEIPQKSAAHWIDIHRSEVGADFGKSHSQVILLPTRAVRPTETTGRKSVEEMRSGMQAGDKFPPVIVDGSFGLLDGHHRLKAAEAEGHTHIPAIFYDDHDYIPHTSGDLSLEDVQNAIDYRKEREQSRVQKGFVFRKAYISAHQRTGANGEVQNVRQHDDSRIDRADVPHPALSMPSDDGGALTPFQERIMGQPEQVEQTAEPQALPQPQNPVAEYAQQGTLATTFRNWFGNWSEKPRSASQIRHITGEPKVMFPAEGSNLVDENGTPTLTGRVAGQFPAMHFSERSVTPPKPFDALHETVPPQYRHPAIDHATALATQYGMPEPQSAQQDIFLKTGSLQALYPATEGDPIYEQLAKRVGDLASYPTTPAYLNVRNPLHDSKPVEASQVQSLAGGDPPFLQSIARQTMRRTGVGEDRWMKKVIGSDILSGLDEIGQMHRTPEVLGNAGYDGIVHTHTGNDGRQEQRVTVFAPSQVKSVANVGTFDPQVEDIYKALVNKRNQEAVEQMLPYRKPEFHDEVRAQYPVDTFYHGTPHDFDQFSAAPPARETTDPNSLIGTHFGEDIGQAFPFINGKYNKKMGGHIIHARLNVANPLQFDSEEDLRKHMIEQARGVGITERHIRDAAARGITHDALRRSPGGITQEFRSHIAQRAATMPYDELIEEHNSDIVTKMTAKHKDKMAQAVRDHLMANGHDSIRYRNAHEGIGAGYAIIVPDQSKIEIVKKDKYGEDGELVKSITVTQAASETAVPTLPQKEAGNYKKGRFRWHGMEIAIENPKGSYRTGSSWKVKMKHHYGYFARTKGADGDALDVFIGDHLSSPKVFIVDQQTLKGKWDEHKVLIGFRTQQEALSGYMKCYSLDWKGMGQITELTIPAFRAWLAGGGAMQPIAMTKATPLL